jgi:hypothetical protein
MKNNLRTPAVLAAIAAGFLSGCNSERITSRTDRSRSSVAQVSEGYDTIGRRWGDNNPEMLTRTGSMLLTFSGTIVDIDYKDRELTLKDSTGRIETFVVAESVQRFTEAKVGDKLSLEYYLGFDAQVRKPTAEEEQNPLVVVETVGRAGQLKTPLASLCGGFVRW